MKKFLTICSSLLLAWSGAKAQSALVLQSPEVDVEYQVTAMSPNGKWACGNVNDGYARGFRWNLTTGEFIELSPQGYNSVALSVSNDGTVAGTFMDDQFLSNGGTIEAAGYYKDGEWHHLNSTLLDAPGDDVAGSQAQAISPNGKLVAGIAVVNRYYTPVVWNIETGEMSQYIFKNPDATRSSQSVGSIFAIADNGTACGYLYRTKTRENGSTVTNRTCAIWTSPNDTICPAWESFGPYCYANSISSDGTKVLAYDRVYDITTKTSTSVISFDNYISYLLYNVNNNGTVAGYAQVDMDSSADAVIIKDGKVVKVADLLSEAGADMSKYPYLIQAVSVSDDENTYLLMAYDTESVPRALAVKLGENVTTPAPAYAKAKALDGVGAVELVWAAPLANASAVTGYDIYRNGTKVNSQPLTTLYYVDNGLADGEYSYTVKALYDGATSEDSPAATANVAQLSTNAPTNLIAVQRGLNNVRLMWDAPLPALPSYTYTNDVQEIYSLGGGEYSFENAVRLRSELLASYSAKGMKLSDVCFYPMASQPQWTVNIYTADNDSVAIYSQTVDGSGLQYGVQNRIHLTTPVTIPEGKDLIVGIGVNVSKSSYNVVGVTFGQCTPGYTDLMRRADQTHFYSLYDQAQISEDGAYMYETAWPIMAMFSDEAGSQAAEVKNYRIYANNAQVSELTATESTLTGVADGEYTYGVSAIANSGSESAQATAQLTLKKNTDVYKPLNVQVTVKESTMTATWEQPADDNRTVLTYSSNTPNGGTAGAFMAKTTYSRDVTRSLDGYQVKAFRFYPLADADFTFYLEKDGERVVELPVDSYTLNQWNEVKLDEPVTLDCDAEYGLILDLYDVLDETAALAQDNQLSHKGVSDLYSTDEGESFSSLATDGGKNANWMMGMVLGTAEAADLHVKGYNVRIDNQQVNTETLSTTTYQQTFSDTSKKTHRLQVQALYDEPTTATYSSDLVYFVIDPTSAINDVTANGAIQVTQGTTHLQVAGVSVKQLDLYAANGALTARSASDSVSISNLSHGVYVLVISTNDGKKYSQKVQI